MGIYLWMQTIIAIIFSAALVVSKLIRAGSNGEVLNYQTLMKSLMGSYMLLILFVSAALALILCLLIYKWRKIPVAEHMKLKPTSSKFLFLAIPTGLAIEFAAMIIFSLTASFFKQSASNYESIMTGITTSGYAFVVIGIVAPIVEDVIFRGLILNELRRNYSVATAIIIQGILFGILHLNIAQAMYAAFAGIILGLIAVAADSVIPAILAHMVMNSSALALQYVDEATLNNLLVPIITVSFVFLIVTCYQWIRKVKHDNKKTEDLSDLT